MTICLESTKKYNINLCYCIKEFTREFYPHLQQQLLVKKIESFVFRCHGNQVTVIRKGQTECFECQAKPTQKAVCSEGMTSGPPSVPSREWIHIPPGEVGKIIHSTCHFLWDMLVPWRVTDVLAKQKLYPK